MKTFLHTNKAWNCGCLLDLPWQSMQKLGTCFCIMLGIGGGENRKGSLSQRALRMRRILKVIVLKIGYVILISTKVLYASTYRGSLSDD